MECKDILALCDRFEVYLTPLDIHILRQRYNGRVFKSTYAVARDMGLSDETVRGIENRALAMLDYCLRLEAEGEPIVPLRLAKSFRQPVADLICRGLWRSASCLRYTAHRGELLIYAPKEPLPVDEFERLIRHRHNEIEHMTAYPRGAIVGRALLVNCIRPPIPASKHQWVMVFDKPEIFARPVPYRGRPLFFYVDAETSQRLPERYPYRYSTSQPTREVAIFER